MLYLCRTLLLMCLLGMAMPAHATRYTMTTLGLGSAPDAHFADLNNVSIGAINDIHAGYGPQSYLVHDGVCTLAPGAFYQVKGINDHGVISGTVFGAQMRAFKYENGAMHDLGNLGGDAEAGRINNLGTVAGIALTGAGAIHAVTFDGKGVHDLGTLGGDFSAAQDINDTGSVVGQSNTADGDPAGHAFLYQEGVMHDLGTLTGGTFSNAQAINSQGVVAGYADVADRYRAFVYSNGAMTALAAPDWAYYSYAMGLNDAGAVVGNSRGLDGRAEAFLYADGVLTPLTALLDNAQGWQVTDAYDINNSGHIAAKACRNDGSCELVMLSVLSPAPEADVYVLLLAGLGLLAVLAAMRGRPANGPGAD